MYTSSEWYNVVVSWYALMFWLFLVVWRNVNYYRIIISQIKKTTKFPINKFNDLSVRTHAFCHTTTTTDGIRYHWTTLASYGLMKFSSIYSVSCYSQKTNIIKERRRIMFFFIFLWDTDFLSFRKTGAHNPTDLFCKFKKLCKNLRFIL